MAIVDELFSLKGQVALVTGGNGGIGQAIAMAFQAAGAQVAVTGRNSEKNEAMARALGEDGAVYELDVRDVDGVERTVAQIVERFGRLDILVNNAGSTSRTPFLEMSRDEWDAVIDVHLTGAFLCSQQAAKVMVDGGRRGKIINIGSMYSIFGPPNVAHYASAKTGMVGLTRALAVELAEYDIQVNAILPGWHETDLNRGLLRSPVGDEIRYKTPARRIGAPQDLAGAAIFFASPAAAFVTGASLPVDGGYSVADRRWED